MKIEIPCQLSDAQLLTEVTRLAQCERENTARLVAHLAELDARRLFVPAGFASLFVYCCEVLRLSEHAAYDRIEVARAVRRFPLLLERLADGLLNLTTARLLAPHLTPENHGGLIAQACGRSRREVEELVARLRPRPDVPAAVRKLPNRAPSGAVAGAAAVPTATVEAPATPPEPHPACPRSGSRAIEPLAPQRYRLQFTVDRATYDALRQVQDLLRREIPDGDPGAIFARALTLLVQDIARRKTAATGAPRPARDGAAGSRHVPAHVKRAVWLRDGGRCAFVARGGRRCGERAFLEFHHVHPYALGGPASVGNISLRCRVHNAHEAQIVFGADRSSLVREANVAYTVVRPSSEVRTRFGTSRLPAVPRRTTDAPVLRGNPARWSRSP